MTASDFRDIVMLVVEDNPADVVFLEEAVEASRTPARMHVVGDGDDALRFLRRQAPHGDAPRPDVIVLDLNVPVKNGREVLAEMAADPELQTIPVAVLTTSTSESWVCDLYPPGQCKYFFKTEKFQLLQEIIRNIAEHARGPKQ
jgi:CheY-like chemotaxis protein